MLNILEEGVAFPGCHVVRADCWNQGFLEGTCTLMRNDGTRIKSHVVFSDYPCDWEASPVGTLSDSRSV
jgi:hypothetical protein